MQSGHSIKSAAIMFSFVFMTGLFANGPATAQMPPPGNALSFDNADDYVDLGDTIENFTAITFEAWIYTRRLLRILILLPQNYLSTNSRSMPLTD